MKKTLLCIVLLVMSSTLFLSACDNAEEQVRLQVDKQAGEEQTRLQAEKQTMEELKRVEAEKKATEAQTKKGQ